MGVWRPLLAVLAVGLALGCSRGPRLPKELAFAGVSFEKARADDGLTDTVVDRCGSGTPGCWDEVCRQMWETHRVRLETLVRQVAPSE